MSLFRRQRVVHVEAPAYAADENRAINVRNVAAIANYSRGLADAVGGCLSRGEFPLVLGGDCSILLGNMLGLRRRGDPALIYIDGHTDFYLPEQSTSGGAAGMDLAFVTGWGPEALTNIEGLMPYVREERVAALGNRDFDRPPPASIPYARHRACTTATWLDCAKRAWRKRPRKRLRLFTTGNRAKYSSMSMSMFSIPPSCRLSIRRRPTACAMTN